MSERDKIVAFLRREAEETENRSYDLVECEGAIMRQGAAYYHGIADRIENGDHLVKPKPTIPFAEWCDKPSCGH